MALTPGNVVRLTSFAGRRVHGSYTHREVALVVSVKVELFGSPDTYLTVVAGQTAVVNSHYVSQEVVP